ncbi:MAG: hypothetical protein J7L15_06215 [Clostridiales bacterium]|nr:hypothetical protein [Clostridiales bacterium]
MEATLKLTRPAKAKGGDRYETILENETNPLVIYLPQSITRIGNTPYQELNMTITVNS